eukprot:6192884-Pleurochrysis_carterae.AAC.2
MVYGGRQLSWHLNLACAYLLNATLLMVCFLRSRRTAQIRAREGAVAHADRDDAQRRRRRAASDHLTAGRSRPSKHGVSHSFLPRS